ncbi:tripartite tricarboxylate transporter substrate binding protein [Achromobacter sp. ACM04]|uniref:Argininosuccinate lyase n=1 Tax=Achromobacter aegrifaciens TaxID=1287736 RepID=A0AAD2J0Y0_ACHAE|nr:MULTISPECIES: tripartite tricarboxylate transporter substrate binding protein [Achromobacter]MBD9383061.1 tripartite tricarboxylate transporter substrate binding protein [Achromobacter sp. ACM02]MBD9422810.1 tripartite tricarboxylate transporter substrate binding protein [Achromobacter sp. ACM04]MBD9430112.1 tripartite tricarboxylate transporter substrate binding protein [Achromobacter sp. ACM03]MBD9471646.1 tripartite tricarboxylate transporter substrate binding protein [Achromobacter sp. A
MKRILQSLALSCAAMAATAAWAAPYPDKPIRMIVPAAAGGAADTLARMIGRGLTEKFGQPVVIENKPGAAAIVGMSAIAKAPADGYTLGMTFSGAMSINPSLYQQLPYDPVKDFAPITIVAVSPLVIAVSPKLGPKSLGEFLALAKKDPGKLTFGSAGTGSTQHLSMELLKSTAGVDMLHVPYKGSSAALVDVQSGLISAVSDNAITLVPLIQSGQLVPLAVETAQRIQSLPEVPTVAESGYPGFQAAGWYGLLAPAGTPQPIVAQLNAALREMVDKPDFTQWLRQQGMEPQTDTPEGFGRYISQEKDKWAQVIKTAKVPLQASR